LPVLGAMRPVEKSLTAQDRWGKRGFSEKRGGAEKHFPTHLLSGAMVCGECGGAVAKVSGKGGGRFGCLGAAKGACGNKMLVRRKPAEKVILEAVREHLLAHEQIQRVLERVEEEVRKLYADVPETIRLKGRELALEERRMAKGGVLRNAAC